MYLRVFGNELRYMNFHGLESLLSGPNINILEMLIQLSKDNDYTFTHSTMFLDSSMIIPTGAGFPMNLTVNGTATMDLKLKGKMDLRSPPNVDIEGLIQPRYSKTCLKQPLKNRQRKGLKDRRELNAGQKYCRMLSWSILQYF